jgi:hypothetical protein
MNAWKFAETDDDGRAWLQHPDVLHAIIDFRSGAASTTEIWRRISVVTKGWVHRQLADSARVVFSAMLVLPDAEPEALRASIDAAVAAGGLEHFGMSLE